MNEGGLEQAWRVCLSSDNKYHSLITTGGPDLRYGTMQAYAEQSANYFISKGLPAETVIVVSTSASAHARAF